MAGFGRNKGSAIGIADPPTGAGTQCLLCATYEDTRREFQLQVPKYINFTADMVDRWAQEEPKKLR